MAKRVAIGNNKGGAKKSTNTVRLAEALARKKKRVLVAEMDPQGNASRRLGWVFNKDRPQLTISEAIEANAAGVAAQAIQPIGWGGEYGERIAILPARFTLENRAAEAGQVGAYRRLAKALRGADDHFDYTLFDCPPSLGHLTQMALAAADWALASTEPEHDSVEAAVRYRAFVADTAEDLANPELRFAGVIVAGHDMRVGAHTGQLAGIRQLFGEQMWSPVVPRRSAITNADEYARPLTEQTDGKSTEAVAIFDLLADTFIKVVGP
jgi:cellulose biosynthesis protein BcsQ